MSYFRALPPAAIAVLDACRARGCGRRYPISAAVLSMAFSGSWQKAEARVSEYLKDATPEESPPAV
jgi:hypothetical protein